MKGTLDIQVSSGTKDDTGRINEKELGPRETRGLNGPKDIGWAPAGDPAQDIRSSSSSLVEKVRGIARPNGELAEAMEQIRTIAWSSAASDRGCGPAWGDYRAQITGAGRRRDVRRHLRLAGDR